MRFKLAIVRRGIFPGWTETQVIDSSTGHRFYQGTNLPFALQLRDVMESIDWTGLLEPPPRKDPHA